MKIECLELFLHGRDRYESGDIRTVPDALGAYFVNNGWAKDMDGKVPTGDRNKSHGGPGLSVDLQVQKSTLGLKSKVGG